MGGYIQFGLVHGDTVNFYGLTGTDSITFTGTVHGNISPNNVAINFAPGSVNILGFSPTFNGEPAGSSTAAQTTFFVATNEMYKPVAGTGLTPMANNGSISTANYSQYLVYGYTAVTGASTGTATLRALTP